MLAEKLVNIKQLFFILLHVALEILVKGYFIKLYYFKHNLENHEEFSLWKLI